MKNVGRYADYVFLAVSFAGFVIALWFQRGMEAALWGLLAFSMIRIIWLR